MKDKSLLGMIIVLIILCFIGAVRHCEKAKSLLFEHKKVTVVDSVAKAQDSLSLIKK